MSAEAPVLTPAEAAILVEAARLFADPKTGELPTITIRAWPASASIPASEATPRAPRGSAS
jgi:hypothetical protein